jgi:hypothetical protein
MLFGFTLFFQILIFFVDTSTKHQAPSTKHQDLIKNCVTKILNFDF